MAKDLKAEPSKGKGRGGVRTSDELELLKLILDENPMLRDRVINKIEKVLGLPKE